MPRRKRTGPGGARVGAGRPSFGADGRTIVRSIKLSELELARLERAAARVGVPLARFIADAALERAGGD